MDAAAYRPPQAHSQPVVVHVVHEEQHPPAPPVQDQLPPVQHQVARRVRGRKFRHDELIF